MTDYSTMTDEQVNEAIFKAKGWAHGKTTPSLNFKCWYKKLPDGFIDTESDVPDYTHSWELCGELLEEMKSADVDLMYFKTLNKWGVDWLDNDEVEHQCVADTPLRAICEAWLPWREQ